MRLQFWRPGKCRIPLHCLCEPITSKKCACSPHPNPHSKTDLVSNPTWWEVWIITSPPSLPLLLGSPWPGVVVPVRVLFIGKINLFKNYSYLIKLQKHMECSRLLFDHLAWIEHQFLSGIRDLRKARSLWGMMRGVGGVRKSAHQSWLAKGLGLG